MTASAMPATEAGPLEAAARLAPAIRSTAPEIERQRRLLPELLAPMRAEGLFHIAIPESYGGLETDPVTAARVVEELAAADGSAGWCVMIAAQLGAFAGLLPPALALELWGDRRIVAGVARPVGRAVAAPGGFRVTGRWPFASGSSHADWFMGESIVYDGDSPRLGEDGNPASHAVLFPRGDVTVIDTWDTTGLRGTASNDFAVNDVFVPAERALPMSFGEPTHPWAFYRSLPLGVINHGSHALGIARASRDAVIELAQTKLAWGNKPLKSVTRLQGQVAEATVLVESARTYLYAAAQDLWDDVQQSPQPSELLRARARLAAAHAATASVRAVEILHVAAGTSAVFVANPLERQFRDLHTAAAHVMVGPLVYEAAGRVELGLPSEMPFF